VARTSQSRESRSWEPETPELRPHSAPKGWTGQSHVKEIVGLEEHLAFTCESTTVSTSFSGLIADSKKLTELPEPDQMDTNNRQITAVNSNN